jgi:hypothetical protein
MGSGVTLINMFFLITKERQNNLVFVPDKPFQPCAPGASPRQGSASTLAGSVQLTNIRLHWIGLPGATLQLIINISKLGQFYNNGPRCQSYQYVLVGH